MACWGWCHAPIKSRRDILTGDERHSESQSGPRADSVKSESARRRSEPLRKAGRHRPHPNSVKRRADDHAGRIGRSQGRLVARRRRRRRSAERPPVGSIRGSKLRISRPYSEDREQLEQAYPALTPSRQNGCGPGGRGFESCRSHSIGNPQPLDVRRAPDSGPLEPGSQLGPKRADDRSQTAGSSSRSSR
jgi:hypothetical protein